MKIIKFSPKGEAISDFEISKYVDNIMNSEQNEFIVSTNLIIEEIRARIKEGRINTDDIAIYVTDFEGEEFPFIIDKDGRSNRWVNSQEIWDNILNRLL